LHNSEYFYLARAAGFSRGLFLFSLLIANKLRDIVFIPIKLIKSAHDQDWLRSLAYFVRLKSLYVNNTHYNFNLRGLAKKLGCSPASLSRHLKELRNRGLVVDHSGNLCFRGLRKLSVIAEGGKNIGVPVDHKNQLDCLRAQLIRFNLSQQEYNIRKFGVQKCPRRDTPFNFSERTSSCYAGLSAEGVGKVLGLSPAQGAAIRSKLIQIGLLSFHRRFSVLFASGGPCGGLLLRKMKRQGLVPYYAKIREDKVTVERRMELRYERGIS
jgi:DNA-binding Lrp family transcriptional regulator